MKYSRETLRSTALSVKAAWEDALRADHAKKTAEYQKRLKTWTEKEKPATIKALQDALAAIKKDQPVDLWRVRDGLGKPPSAPDTLDCCNGKTKELDGLVELLDTLADDEITATQLNLAGFKNVSQLLRRPC